MNLRWDVLCWNRLNSLLYRDYGALPTEERNLLEILLARPVRHLSLKLLEHTARRVIARLRFDYSRFPDDPGFEALIRSARHAVADLPSVVAIAGVHAACVWHPPLQPSAIRGSGLRAHVLCAGWSSECAYRDVHARQRRWRTAIAQAMAEIAREPKQA